MNRTSLAICLAASMAATVGCSSKNYVKQQTTPLINKTNELDDLTARNTRDIKDVDQRAQEGIQKATSAADAANQKAVTAGQSADQAQNTLRRRSSQRKLLLHVFCRRIVARIDRVLQ